MAVVFACRCGKRYQVGEEFIGQQVTCQSCHATITVPAPGRPAARPVSPPVEEEIIDLPDEPAPAPRQSRPTAGGKSGAVTRGASGKTRAIQPPDRRAQAPAGGKQRFEDPEPSGGKGKVLLLLGILFFLFCLLTAAAGGGLLLYYHPWDDESSTSSSSQAKADSKDTKKTDKDGTETTDQKGTTEPETPDTKVPDTKVPDTKVPDTKVPDTKVPDTKVPDPVPPPSGPWKGTTSSVVAIGFGGDGQTIWTASGGQAVKDGKAVPGADNSLRRWDPEGKQLARLDDFKDGISCASFSLSVGGDYAVIVPLGGEDPNRPGTWTLGADTNLHLWDLRSRREKRLIGGNTKDVFCVAIAPGGLHIASGGRDRIVHVSDADSGAEERTLVGHGRAINAVVFSADAARLASAGGDKSVRVWDRVKGIEERVLEGHKDIVWALAFAPSGQLLASGGGDAYDDSGNAVLPGARDYAVRLWDLDTGKERQAYTGHTARVTTLAFSPDGTRLVSGGKDRTVRLWQVGSGKAVSQLPLTAEVTSLAVAPDGRRVLIGTADGSLRLWDFPLDLAGLIRKLENAQPGERAGLIRELAGYGADARAARPLMLRLLSDPANDVRVEALGLLTKTGAPDKSEVTALTPLLKAGDFIDGRLYAFDALTALGAEAKPALSPLTEALKDADVVIRRKAASALGAIGPEAKAMAFTPLLGLLRDKEPTVVDAAADALSKLGKPEKEHARVVVDLLTHPNEPVRRFALIALADLGSAAAEAAPTLQGYLETEKVPALRKQCLIALARVTPDPREVLQVYTKALADPDVEMSKTAATGLSKIGTEGGALPSLLRGLENANPEVAQTCQEAVTRGPITKDHVPLLRQALPGTKESARLTILAVLGKLGPDAALAVPGLVDVLKVGEAGSRKEAVVILGQIGAPARAAGPEIVARLKDADTTFRLEIARTLKKIGAPEIKEAVPYLVKGLKVDNPDAEADKAQRKEVSETLIAIGVPAVEPLMRALEKDFKGKDTASGEARMQVLKTLQGIGNPAYSSDVHRRLVAVRSEETFPTVKKEVTDTLTILQKK
jgi:WD40 repeat protein/HEAT repeat protein